MRRGPRLGRGARASRSGSGRVAPRGRPRSPPRRRPARGRCPPPAPGGRGSARAGRRRRRLGQGRAGHARADRAATIEDDAAIHPAEHARVVLHAQDGRPTPGQLRQQVGDARRACRIELRGRLVEDQDGRAHRHDAGDRHPLLLATGQGERLAVGEVADRQAGQRGVDPLVHLGPGHAQVLEAEGQLLADRQLRGGQLVGRRREDDPDPAEQRAARRGRGVDPLDGHPAVDLGPHDPGDEPGGSEREGRLAGPRSAGHAHLAAGRDREIDTRQARFATGRIPHAETLDPERRRGVVGVDVGGRRHRGTIPKATSRTPMAATRPAAEASDRSAGRRRPDRRSGPAVPRTPALRARTSAPGRPPAIRAAPA